MKRITFIFTFLFITFSSLNVNALSSSNRADWDSSKYFDTYSVISVWDEAGLNGDQIEDIEEIMMRIQNTFSRTEPESELYQVNENAGGDPVEVSPELFEIIKQAKEYGDLSLGKFDLTIGALVDTWEIDPDNFEWVPPSEAELQSAGTLLGYEKVVLDEENLTVYLPEEGMVLDLGGIAKGYAADKIKEYLVEQGFEHAIINLGGNVLTVGNRYTGNEGWYVGIQDPEAIRGSGQVGTLQVTDKTVVTSGTYERYNIYNNTRYHHIIDTETYSPVDNDLYCVTIITDSSADADALSTSTFALGVVDGLELVESLDNVEAVFITTNQKIVLSSGLSGIDTFELYDDNKSTYKVVSLDEYLYPEKYEDSLLDKILVPSLVISGGIVVGITIWFIYRKIDAQNKSIDK